MLVTSTANMSTGVTTKDSWRLEPGTLGNIQQPNQRKQPASLTDGTLVPIQIWPSRVLPRTADCSWKFSWSQKPSPHHWSSTFLPTAIQWSIGTFARLIGSAFTFSQMNLLRNCHLQTHQTMRGHTRIFVRAYYLRLNNVSHVAVGRIMCHAGTKPSIAALPRPQWGLTQIDWLRLFYLDSSKRNRSDGRKLLIPSTSCTPAARCGEPWTNLLPCLDVPLTSFPSRQTLSPHNLWRTEHTGPGIASPPGWSTNSCPTYGRFQHLRVTVSLNPLGQRSFLLPSDIWSRETPRDWIPSSQSLYSLRGQLSNLGFATSSLPACANS